MSDLGLPDKKDVVPSKPGKKITKVVKKPIPGEHIKNTRIQVHRGNLDILDLQFSESTAKNTFGIYQEQRETNKLLGEILRVLEKRDV